MQFSQQIEQNGCIGGYNASNPNTGEGDCLNNCPNSCVLQGGCTTFVDNTSGVCALHADACGSCGSTFEDTGGTYPECPAGYWPCSSYDWPGSLCSSWICTPSDPSLCWSDGNLKVVSTNFTTSNINQIGNGTTVECPVNGGNDPCPPQAINCNYNPAQFTTIEQATSFLQFNWGTYQSEAQTNWSDIIMPQICTQTASSLGLTAYCPNNDAFGGEQMPDCSAMVLVGDPGNYGSSCATWCSSNSSSCDTAMTTYCSENNTDDCACINRGTYSQYNAFINGLEKQGVATQGSCFWEPCQVDNLIPYLVPSSIASEPCPEVVQICDQLTAIISILGGQVGVGTNQGFVDCNQGSDATGGAGNFNSKDLTILIIIVVVIAVIIGVIGMILLFTKPKKKKT